MFLVECENCKQKFDIYSDEVLNHKKEFKINGESILLTYYDCPSCGRRHFVQVDNEVSLAKLEKTKEMFVKFTIAKRKGKEIPEKQQAKFKKMRKDLSDYRTNLMKQYTDKSIVDEDGNLFVLRFSV